MIPSDQQNNCNKEWIVEKNAPILVTGGAGFIGSRVVGLLLKMGFENVICNVRRSSDLTILKNQIPNEMRNHIKIVEANLLSKDECKNLSKGIEIVYHLVAGRGKSFPGCFQGSVITTRNLLDALIQFGKLNRFVNVSSFAVYSTYNLKKGSIWDENCPLEDNPNGRYDAYAFGKLKQEELILYYYKQFGIPFTIVRPGIVFGPGKKGIPGFVGIDTFGIFLHLGGNQKLPLTYVDNCAEAIVLAGLIKGIEGEVFNVVDDQLPTSRWFLHNYKKRVRKFWSISIPYHLTYILCTLWEWYAKRSKGQLPPVFNRRTCLFAWRGYNYSNKKLKTLLGWQCRVSMDDGLQKYFEYQKRGSDAKN